jgi:farnesyl-diphosphate farnesyltransferase
MTGRSSTVRTMKEISTLLREHARTMALSLRLLPRPLREPLGLAYLLARASDTIADSGRMPREERATWLEEIRDSLAEKKFDPQPRNHPEDLTSAELGLLDAFPSLFALLEKSPDREELIGLWCEILEGQLFDLRRFMPGSPSLDSIELERYCDLVAGSVGRCWTRLIARHAPGIVRAPVAELLPLASDYGKGLQLLNILRDREADRAMGRHYVVEENVPASLARAREWIAAGDRYLRSFTPGRILMASSLPLDLAMDTLPLIASASPGTRAKLSRPTVRKALAAGMLSLVLPRRSCLIFSTHSR